MCFYIWPQRVILPLTETFVSLVCSVTAAMSFLACSSVTITDSVARLSFFGIFTVTVAGEYKTRSIEHKALKTSHASLETRSAPSNTNTICNTCSIKPNMLHQTQITIYNTCSIETNMLHWTQDLLQRTQDILHWTQDMLHWLQHILHQTHIPPESYTLIPGTLHEVI